MICATVIKSKFQVQTRYEPKEIVNSSRPAEESFPAPPPPAPQASSFPPPPEFLKPEPPKQFTKAPPIETRPSVFSPKTEVDKFSRSLPSSGPKLSNGSSDEHQYSQALVDEINSIQLSEERNCGHLAIFVLVFFATLDHKIYLANDKLGSKTGSQRPNPIALYKSINIFQRKCQSKRTTKKEQQTKTRRKHFYCAKAYPAEREFQPA